MIVSLSLFRSLDQSGQHFVRIQNSISPQWTDNNNNKKNKTPEPDWNCICILVSGLLLFWCSWRECYLIWSKRAITIDYSIIMFFDTWHEHNFIAMDNCHVLSLPYLLLFYSNTFDCRGCPMKNVLTCDELMKLYYWMIARLASDILLQNMSHSSRLHFRRPQKQQTDGHPCKHWTRRTCALLLLQIDDVGRNELVCFTK